MGRVVRFLSCSAFCILTFPGWLSATPGQPSQVKPPEDWTLEERLERRFDPSQARHRRAVETSKSGPGDETVLPDDMIVVDGAENPEILLPGELFDRLLALGFSPDPDSRTVWRKILHPTLVSLGFEESFWRRLEDVAQQPLGTRSRLHELREQLKQASQIRQAELRAEMESLGGSTCGDRAVALNKAKEVFGAQRFQKLLYQGVAPHTKTVMPADTSWTERLRWMEGGCQ